MDMDADGTLDFAVNGGIIIAEGRKTHCARITAINSTGLVTFVPSVPPAFTPVLSDTMAVPAAVYELSGTSLTRNTVTLSSQVEDLQIEFGVDVNQDGQLGAGEGPINNLNDYDSTQAQFGYDPRLIRLVRLSVLTRTSREDANVSTPGRLGLANRAGSGTADSFQRRLVSVSAAPRNILWGNP
jgi:hypothetical protein